jgi:adenosylhomocysteine nucleosidase
VTQTRVLAVVGLAREAKIVGRERVRVVIGGGNSTLLAQKIEEAIAEERDAIRGVISIGIAGALIPDFDIGDCAIATGIVQPSARTAADERWYESMSLLIAARRTLFAGMEAVLGSAKDKASLAARTGAGAVDMESHVAARIAETHGIPFAALRVISDRADHAMPAAALVAMKPDGGIAFGAVARSVLANPLQIPALIRLGRDSETAFESLQSAVDTLGPSLGCPYLD